MLDHLITSRLATFRQPPADDGLNAFGEAYTDSQVALLWRLAGLDWQDHDAATKGSHERTRLAITHCWTWDDPSSKDMAAVLTATGRAVLGLKPLKRVVEWATAGCVSR